MTRRSEVLDALAPSPTVSAAPALLARLGLRAGGTARVSTRRGSVLLAVRADGGLPEDVLFIPFAYREAAANLLTDSALDPFGKIPGFKYCAARLDAPALLELAVTVPSRFPFGDRNPHIPFRGSE